MTPDCSEMLFSRFGLMSCVAWRGTWNILCVIGLHHQSCFLPGLTYQHPAAFSFLMSSFVFIVRSVLI